MNVYIPTPLRSYTDSQGEVQAEGATVREVLKDLERLYPGIRFRIVSEQDRIRDHIKIFVNHTAVPDLAAQVQSTDDLHIICALSGG